MALGLLMQEMCRGHGNAAAPRVAAVALVFFPACINPPFPCGTPLPSARVTDSR